MSVAVEGQACNKVRATVAAAVPSNFTTLLLRKYRNSAPLGRFDPHLRRGYWTSRL